MNQGMQGASRNWKKKTSHKAIQNSSEETLILPQGDPGETSDPKNCKITFCCIKPLIHGNLLTTATGNRNKGPFLKNRKLM